METFEPGLQSAYNTHQFKEGEQGMKCRSCARVMTIPEWEEKRKCFCQNTSVIQAVARSSTPIQLTKTGNLNKSKNRSDQWTVAIIKITVSCLGISFLLATFQRHFNLRLNQFDTSIFSKVYYSEHFSSPDLQYWALNEDARIKDSGLFQHVVGSDLLGMTAWHKRSFTNVDFSADVFKASGSSSVPYGICARSLFYKGDWRGYCLRIKGNKFSLSKVSGDFWDDRNPSSISEFHISKAIKTGNQKNNLRIVIKENLVIGFINTERVGHFRDSEYKSGIIALESQNSTSGSVAIYFDNVLIKVMEDD